MINNIKNNTISEADAKQKLNALDKIKKIETKNKRLINGQKILLNNNNDENENMNENENENEGENENEMMIIMMMMMMMMMKSSIK